MIQNTVNNKVFPPLLKDVTVQGEIQKRMDRFFYERVFSENAHKVIYQEAEDAFKNQLDGENAIGIWQGEFWGKWIISAVKVCQYTGDETLKEFIRQAANRLIRFQREDGYIGTYKNSLNLFPPSPEKAIQEVGWPCDWNWNIWCRKYTLWGLVESFLLLGDENILTAAQRHASQMLQELEQNHIDILKTGKFLGMPSCSIMKPMLLLYEITEDKSYLDFCLSIAHSWENPQGDPPQLIFNALSGKPVAEWYPHPEKWAKAYEMMSCFEGLCELYRVTGKKDYLEACESVYSLLKQHEQNPIFSVGYNDLFTEAKKEINGITEPCDVIHWMRLCYELFTLTGKAMYMDSFEQAFCNAFLAGVFEDGTWGARGVRTAGRHLWVHEQAKMKYNHCCVNNMPRGFMNMAEAAVMNSENSIYINMPIECHTNLDIGGTHVSVKISSGYFAKGKVTIQIEFSSEYAGNIKIRIPSWCQSPSYRVNTGAVTRQDAFLTVNHLKGTCFTAELDYHPWAVLHHFEKPVPCHGSEDWKRVRWLNNNTPGETDNDSFLEDARFYITYGSLVLARSNRLGCTQQEMFQDVLRGDETYHCTLRPLDVPDALAAFEVELTGTSQSLQTKVCDFASASHFATQDKHFFSIYF